MTARKVRNPARTLTQDELLAEAKERFGDDPMRWAFKCPNCGDVATGRDFREALAAHPRGSDGQPVTASQLLGQECIGRTLGALSNRQQDWKGRGCDWAAYGLFAGPWTVTTRDGQAIHCFPLADANESREVAPQ